MSHPASVAVFGAAGHTGRFVVAELLRRGILPIAIARTPAALAAVSPEHDFPRRTASLDDATSMEEALSGAAAVINCAGPFLDTAEAVASAALRRGIHYLDVTAEQACARATLDHFDAPARQTGIAVIPAMGFYGGFADLLVTAALAGWAHPDQGDSADSWDRADSIDILTGLDHWHPTRGTRLTGQRNTAPRLVVSGGRLSPLPLPPAERDWDFGPPLGPHRLVELPLSEVILISRHVPAAELHSHLSLRALDDIHDPATPAPSASDALGRSAQRFIVDVVVTRAGATCRITARGQDIYAFTAPLVSEAATRLLAGAFTHPGANPPGVLFNAHDFLAALAPEPLTLEFTSS